MKDQGRFSMSDAETAETLSKIAQAVARGDAMPWQIWHVGKEVTDMKQAHPSGTEAIEAAMLGSMGTSTERRLEWACKEIESLLKRVSMLEDPEFWRKEAKRQAAMTIGDPSRLMRPEDIARFTQ